MYNLSIDLEMCNVPRDYRQRSYKYANETIQIGAVLLDENFKRISTLCQYVHPEYGVIDHFIESLTGIRNSQVKNAPRIQEALLHMIDWLGDREYQIYAWSESDRAQIVHEIKAKKITDEKILAFVEKENWIDYQAMEARGISTALGSLNRLIRALNDMKERTKNLLQWSLLRQGQLMERMLFLHQPSLADYLRNYYDKRN